MKAKTRPGFAGSVAQAMVAANSKPKVKIVVLLMYFLVGG